MINTARFYDVETQIGRAIKKSDVPREDIFLGASLHDLDTPYVDLLLIHYPSTYKRGPERFPRNAEGCSRRDELHWHMESHGEIAEDRPWLLPPSICKSVRLNLISLRVSAYRYEKFSVEHSTSIEQKSGKFGNELLELSPLWSRSLILKSITEGL